MMTGIKQEIIPMQSNTPPRPSVLPIGLQNGSVIITTNHPTTVTVSSSVSQNAQLSLPQMQPATTLDTSQILARTILPLTPPDSQPGSPEHEYLRHTPPPPYPGHITATSIIATPLPGPTPKTESDVNPKHRPTHPGCSTIKYNRRNNPDLEKRRIHFCDFPGKFIFTFIKYVGL